MLDSPIFDIIIGLSFLYFLLGLITSSLNELIQTRLNSRSKELHKAILNFLDRDWYNIANKVIKSPYVRSISKTPDKFPSYIPAHSFAQSIIDVIKGAEDLPETIPEIRKQIRESKIIHGDVETWLLGMLDQSFDKVQDFYLNIETSYNEAMERVSEWYGKKVKKAIMLLGILISILLNIDTINITQTLWNNKEMAKTLSAMVAGSMENMDKSGSGFEIKDAKGKVLYSVENEQSGNISNVVAEIGELPIPIGWASDSFAFFREPGWQWTLLSMLAGWTINAMAIFLGAPFWFDLLSKVVNLRGSGGKPKVMDA
jgi:hypothetical protein